MIQAPHTSLPVPCATGTSDQTDCSPKKPFVEPLISSPLDLLEMTRFFFLQVQASGSSGCTDPDDPNCP
ncbi:MAG: hypothetical protein U0Z53_06480 [Blastocatellia bacterium]